MHMNKSNQRSTKYSDSKVVFMNLAVHVCIVDVGRVCCEIRRARYMLQRPSQYAEDTRTVCESKGTSRKVLNSRKRIEPANLFEKLNNGYWGRGEKFKYN